METTIPKESSNVLIPMGSGNNQHNSEFIFDKTEEQILEAKVPYLLVSDEK